MLPPLPVAFFPTGIIWEKDGKEATYLFLSQNIALEGNLLPKHVSTKFPRDIPCNYFCPSLKDALIKRACKLYDLFLGASNPSRTTVQTAGQKDPLKAAINKGNSLWEMSHHKERVATKKSYISGNIEPLWTDA